MALRPVLGQPPKGVKRPIVGEAKPPRRFVFSFRHFKQDRYFGLGGLEASWFVSLFEKMSEISEMDYERLMTDFRAKNVWRLHEVDFSARSVPVLRQNLTWISKTYLENPEEYPFFQFQITTAHGRVIGFWDEQGDFNIVF